jgi:hypothetical protein
MIRMIRGGDTFVYGVRAISTTVRRGKAFTDSGKDDFGKLITGKLAQR